MFYTVSTKQIHFYSSFFLIQAFSKLIEKREQFQQCNEDNTFMEILQSFQTEKPQHAVIYL